MTPLTSVSAKRYPPPAVACAWCHIEPSGLVRTNTPALYRGLPLDDREAPLDARDEIGQILAPPEPLVADPVAVADDGRAGSVEVPGGRVRHLSRSEGPGRAQRASDPLFQALVGKQVLPPGRIRVQGAARLRLQRGQQKKNEYDGGEQKTHVTLHVLSGKTFGPDRGIARSRRTESRHRTLSSPHPRGNCNSSLHRRDASSGQGRGPGCPNPQGRVTFFWCQNRASRVSYGAKEVAHGFLHEMRCGN